MKLRSRFALFRSTPGSTSLGPAYTSALAATGQALEFLASSDRSAFVKLVNGVAQALQDSVSDMQKSGSKRARCDQPPLAPNISPCFRISRNCRQLLPLPPAASHALTLISPCAASHLYPCRRLSFRSIIYPEPAPSPRCMQALCKALILACCGVNVDICC